MSLLDHPILAPAGSSAAPLRRALGLTIALALVVLAILLPVMQSSDETTQGYRIHTLQGQQSELQAQIYSAQSDIAQLGSLSRIDGDARTRLGLVPVNHEMPLTVSVPQPNVRTIPNSYLPPSSSIPQQPRPSLWKKIVTLISFI